MKIPVLSLIVFLALSANTGCKKNNIEPQSGNPAITTPRVKEYGPGGQCRGRYYCVGK